MTLAIRVNSIEAFILAARFKTLGAMLLPIVIGNTLAIKDQNYEKANIFLTVICGIFLQILANFVNDYGDFLKGADQEDRVGPKRALASGIITQSAIEKAIATIAFVIVLCGSLVVLNGGIYFLIIGIVSLFFAFWYTLGSRPLSYLGFAEIVVFFLFGPLPLLSVYYLHTSTISAEAIVLCITPACLSTSLLLVNNIRDVKQDAKNNKKTIVVRLGVKFCQILLGVLLVLTFLSPIMLVLLFDKNLRYFLSLLPLLFVLIMFFKTIIKDDSPMYNKLLASIGKANYLLCLFFMAAILSENY